jgi:hypothetical protein
LYSFQAALSYLEPVENKISSATALQPCYKTHALPHLIDMAVPATCLIYLAKAYQLLQVEIQVHAADEKLTCKAANSHPASAKRLKKLTARTIKLKTNQITVRTSPMNVIKERKYLRF